LKTGQAPILDVGCGTGLSGLSLDAAGFTVIDGCDHSPEMLANAQVAGCYRRLFETDLNKPPLDVEDGAYAAATCVGVFSFDHVLPDAIDEILRVIRECGFIVIGLNDHFYEEGSFPRKINALVSEGKLEILDKTHGTHLRNVDGSTGWVFTCRKI
jgi:SAM-dependent methyltransferase